MLIIEAKTAGGPEVLVPAEREVPSPGPGQILLRQEAVGLNFIDAYHRMGRYPIDFPAVIGVEGAGTVEAVGEGVTRFAPGDRAAYAGPLGGYAQYRTLPADKAVKLPTDISIETAAGGMLKGLTAHMLLFPVGQVTAADTILVHSAAGGVGSLVVQWAKSLGAKVIGTAGDAAKAQRAIKLGADDVILYKQEDIAQRVRAITNGEGVRVVLDGVGRATFDASLASLKRRGLMVSFGGASGVVEPVDISRLQKGGSLSLIRPTLFDFIATVEELDNAAEALFEALRRGEVRVDIGQSFPLSQAGAAHKAMEAAETIGSTILIP